MNTLAGSSIFMSLFLFTIISLNTFSSYAFHFSYTNHCASMVPKSTPNESKLKAFPHGQLHDGYCLGGGPMDDRAEQKHFTLQIKNVFETDVAGIHNVRARLMIRSATWYYRVPVEDYIDETATFIKLSLDGFWSESSGKLCMVGTETGDSAQLQQRLEVVLKLYNVANSSNTIYSLVTGSLESLSPKHEVSYFEPISLFILPRMDYEYTLDTKEAKDEYANEGEQVPSLSINLVKFCSKLFPMINDLYELQYQSECNSSKNCSPIFGGDANQLPYILSLNALGCSDVKQRVKVFIGFGNYESGYYLSFNPNASFVGEGWWDEEKNQLCIVGCHFLGMDQESMASVHLGDCSLRMILRFPKIWSINDASSIVGQLWSNKTFKTVILRNHQDRRERISGIKYEYSLLEKVRKMCPRQEPPKNKGRRYPDVYSSDMRFDMIVEDCDKVVAWGYFGLFAVNNKMIQIQKLNSNENFASKSSHRSQPFIFANSSTAGIYNVSYQIRFTLTPFTKLGVEKSLLTATTCPFDVEINIVSGEGVYDAEAGSSCMVGCRNLGSKNQIPTTDSVDCEIIVKFQFLQLKAKGNGPFVTASVESTRKNSDPFYFNSFNLSSFAYVSIRNRWPATGFIAQSATHTEFVEEDLYSIHA